MTIHQELIKAQAEANAARQELAIATDKLSELEKEKVAYRDASIAAEEQSKKLSAENAALAARVSHFEAEAGKVEAEIEKRSNLKAQEIARKQGVPSVKEVPSVQHSRATMTREAFEHLPHVERNTFIRNGGTLTH